MAKTRSDIVPSTGDLLQRGLRHDRSYCPRQSRHVCGSGGRCSFPFSRVAAFAPPIEQADVAVAERTAEAADLRGRIDYEVRTSFLNLNAAREQVEVAQSARKLAAEQLVQARDRFTAGVANNLEVVQAQQAVAVAEENFINSLYGYNLSKASIGRSIGMAQNIPSEYLGVSTP